MPDLAWLDGRVCAAQDAVVPMEDRGYLFGDGIYEVIRFYYTGRLFRMKEHLQRLQNSAAAIRLDLPMPLDQIETEARSLISKSGYVDGYIYMQLTRGSAPRNHIFPTGVRPSMTMFVREVDPPEALENNEPVECITLPDERWMNCFVKTINLLPNLLAFQAAAEAGAKEAILYRPGGVVTEAARSNLFALIDDTVLTHPESNLILSGITRLVVLEVLREEGIPYREEAFSLDDLTKAGEAWITSSVMEISAINKIGGRELAVNAPGPVTAAVMKGFRKKVEQACS